jgi:hypothetical protein
LPEDDVDSLLEKAQGMKIGFIVVGAEPAADRYWCPESP